MNHRFVACLLTVSRRVRVTPALHRDEHSLEGDRSCSSRTVYRHRSKGSKRNLVVGRRRSGCTDRSSSTMAADRASVARATAGTVDASFQVGLVSGRNLQVRLEASDGRIRDTISGVSVPAERRATLEVPERPPIANR